MFLHILPMVVNVLTVQVTADHQRQVPLQLEGSLKKKDLYIAGQILQLFYILPLHMYSTAIILQQAAVLPCPMPCLMLQVVVHFSACTHGPHALYTLS